MPPSHTQAGPEALRALRERLAATQQAAKRLADEAARERRPPPAGWDVPRRAEEANAELESLVRVVTGLRDMLPPELRGQLAELVRQLLVFVEAVLDWWVAEVERDATRDARGHAGVEDIPIS